MKEATEFNPQRFGVIGAGPVGCIVAAFLSRAGYTVTLCDVNADLTKPAKESGIIIKGAENFRQKVAKICTSADDLAEDPPDVIFITVKANALPLLASALEAFYKEGIWVVSWQNGIDTERVLAQTLGKKAVIRAVVNYGCELTEPGHVRMAFHHPPHYIQELDIESRHAALAIGKALIRSGLKTSVTDNIISKIWYKSILNASMNPVCAVTGYTMSQAMSDPIVFQLVDALMKECVKVTRANEIRLGWDFYREAMTYLRNAGDHKPSMLKDIEMKRRTEIDFINGKFIEYGQQASVETPYNITFRALVKALEPK